MRTGRRCEHSPCLLRARLALPLPPACAPYAPTPRPHRALTAQPTAPSPLHPLRPHRSTHCAPTAPPTAPPPHPPTAPQGFDAQGLGALIWSLAALRPAPPPEKEWLRGFAGACGARLRSLQAMQLVQVVEGLAVLG